MKKEETMSLFAQGMSIKELAKKHQKQEDIKPDEALEQVERTVFEHMMKTGQITKRL